MANGEERAILAKWLNVQVDPWPPDHFALLGLPIEDTPLVEVERRAFDRMEALRPYQLRYSELVTEGMNLLAQAMVCLSDPAEQAAYVRSLAKADESDISWPSLPSAPVEERKQPELPVAKIVREPLPPQSVKRTDHLDTAFKGISRIRTDADREAVKQRVFVRKGIRSFRQFHVLLEKADRMKPGSKDTETLQGLAGRCGRLFDNRLWRDIGLAGEGEKVHSIAKILHRYPSLEYLVPNQVQDVQVDINKLVNLLEDQKDASLAAVQVRRNARRGGIHAYGQLRTLLRKPEDLALWIMGTAIVIALVRWMLG